MKTISFKNKLFLELLNISFIILLFISFASYNSNPNSIISKYVIDEHSNNNLKKDNLAYNNFTAIYSAGVPNTTKYLREAAYGYAYKWYNSRNPHYKDYSSSGGDCANFVSQCLIAGGLSLHKGTNGTGYGIYPDVDRPTEYSNGTIPYCDYLNLHLRNYQNTNITYIIDTNASIPLEIDIGDVIIFGNKSSDKYKHAMIVVWKNATDLGLAGHSSDVWNRSFWIEFNYFSCATFYHIIDEPANYYHFRVNTAVLNVRVGPGKNGMPTPQFYQDIGDLHQDEEYIAFEYAYDQDNNIWWHFWFDDRAAWVASWYTINVSSKIPFEVNVSTYLNVRDGAGTTYPIFGQVYDGMRFVADMINGSWYRFYYSGFQKYCHKDYIFSIDEYEPISGKNTNKTILGFLPHWINENQNWTALTHLAWFGVNLNANGTIKNSYGWPKNTLVNYLHGNNTKVLLTITMFDSTEIHTLISSSSYRTTAIQTILTQIQAGNADGVCIDFEHPKSSGDDIYLVSFMQELNSTLKLARSDYYVSLCTPSVDWWGTYDYANLAPHVDSFMLMGYGYYYSGSANAGPTAPLYGGNYNLNKSVYAHINNGAPRLKIILGLPFYGYDYPVTNTNKQAPTNGSGTAITYSANMNKKETLNLTLFYDSIYECEWYNYYVNGEGWHQVWCENYTSLDRKMDYINAQDLGGIGIWAWGFQGNYFELESLIIEKFHYDNISPNITIINPKNNEIIKSNPVTINWTGFDNNKISYYEISINNGTEWINIGLNTSYEYNFSDGYYQIFVKAVDSCNNSAITSINITVSILILDYEPPEIHIINPSNGTKIAQGRVNIELNYSDNIGVNLIQISFDFGKTWQNISVTNSIDLNLPIGNYIILIKAIDSSNNYGMDSVYFSIVENISDNQEPNNDSILKFQLNIFKILSIILSAICISFIIVIIRQHKKLKDKKRDEPEFFIIKT